MNNIYSRLLQIVEYKGFKSINDFAKNGLGYSSSEKLNRLKKENTSPGFDIIQDITNKFEDINMNWFVSGKGEMLYNKDALPQVSEPSASYGHVTVANIIEAKDEVIETLKRQNDDLRTDKEFYRDLLKSKFIKD